MTVLDCLVFAESVRDVLAKLRLESADVGVCDPVTGIISAPTIVDEDVLLPGTWVLGM